jgi:hypothetical protein
MLNFEAEDVRRLGSLWMILCDFVYFTYITSILLAYRMGVLAEKSFFKEEVQADLQYTCQVETSTYSTSGW